MINASVSAASKGLNEEEKEQLLDFFFGKNFVYLLEFNIPKIFLPESI